MAGRILLAFVNMKIELVRGNTCATTRDMCIEAMTKTNCFTCIGGSCVAENALKVVADVGAITCYMTLDRPFYVVGSVKRFYGLKI